MQFGLPTAVTGDEPAETGAIQQGSFLNSQ